MDTCPNGLGGDSWGEGSLAVPDPKKGSGESQYKNLTAAGILAAPIKSRHVKSVMSHTPLTIFPSREQVSDQFKMEKERIEDAISFGIHLAATRFGYCSLVSLVHSLIHSSLCDSNKRFLNLDTFSLCYIALFEQGIKL